MTADGATFLTRPDLPVDFDRWEVELAAHSTRATNANEWAGALVLVREGTLEVECAAGGHETFHPGDMLTLGWLPIIELRNPADVPVRLMAVRRRGDARSIRLPAPGRTKESQP